MQILFKASWEFTPNWKSVDMKTSLLYSLCLTGRFLHQSLKAALSHKAKDMVER